MSAATATATAEAAAAAEALLEAHKDWYYFTPQHREGIAARLATEKKVQYHAVRSFAYNMSMAGTWPSIAPDSAGYTEAYEALLREVVDTYCKADAEHRAFMRQIVVCDRQLVVESEPKKRLADALQQQPAEAANKRMKL
jgi:hypothetical protein